MLKTAKTRVQFYFGGAASFRSGICSDRPRGSERKSRHWYGAPFVLSNSPSGILAFFTDGQARFQEVEAVSGGANNGLGPRFNSNSCSSCHAQPTIGGQVLRSIPNSSSPATGSHPKDTTPSFITANGPTREARFPFFFNSNGSVNTNAPNGGVEDLFTVTGRSDAGSCSLSQPSFAAAQQANDIIFRIPTPTFGAGLIENLDDSTLLNNQATNLNNNSWHCRHFQPQR